LSYPPTKIASMVKCPTAIFFGNKDFQLDMQKDGFAIVKALIDGNNNNVFFILWRM